MDKTAKLEYQKDVEKYLETKRVYELFEDLLKELAISKPQNPLDFLIERLSTPEHKMIFIVGPPGSNVRELSLQLADHFKFACVSVGDLLRKEVAKRTEHGMEIESAIKSGRYVNDHLVIELVHKQIAAMQKEKKNCIVEGFPKTVVQGLAMQKAGIIPTTFITLNMSDPKINECVERKFSSPESQTAFLPDRVKHTMAQNYSLEYKLNINGIKKIYNHQYFQVDAEATKEEILEEMARYTRYRLKSKAPRRAARILVVGPPGAGRTTLARALCKRYGFTLVSTPELIHDQVAKKTEIGRMALPLMTRGDLLPDEVIGGLLSERISQSDCLIHGMVIDGFPKVPNHLKLMEELSINPTLIVVLELDNGESSRRMGTHDQEAVQNRQNRWKEMLKALETKYSSLILKINAQKNPKNVLEDASYALENQFA